MNSEELRRRREALGLSQSELARALDVPVNTVWRWEQSAEKTRVGIRHGRILELALEQLAARTAAGEERGEDGGCRWNCPACQTVILVKGLDGVYGPTSMACSCGGAYRS